MLLEWPEFPYKKINKQSDRLALEAFLAWDQSVENSVAGES